MPRFITFVAVGFSGVFINLGMLWVGVERLHLNDLAASAIAIEISIVWNFILNNALTFRDRNVGAKAGFGARMVRYNALALVGLGVQLAAFYLLNRAYVSFRAVSDPGVFRYASQSAGIVIATAWNFLSNLRWTWGQRVTTTGVPAEGATGG